jgi:molybdopterin converting factor small subunit
MRVRLLTFGVLRERLCGLEETVELLEGATVGELIEILRGRTSNTSMGSAVDEGLWRSLAVAVNREYASQVVVLREGDEVALLPPVSGGSCAEGEKRALLASTRADGVALALLGATRTAIDSLREYCVDVLRKRIRC